MKINNKTAVSAVLMGICVLLSSLSSISVYAMTPPSSEELIEGVKRYKSAGFQSEYGVDNPNIVSNTDAVFLYREKRIAEITSEEEIADLIDKSNEDQLDEYSGSWIVTERTSDDTYTEIILSYSTQGELSEVMSFTPPKEKLTPSIISLLIGEQYNSGMKDMLLFAADRSTIFGDHLLAKKFDDGSIKVGVLTQTIGEHGTLDVGWYNFDEIKQFIEVHKKEIPTGNNGEAQILLGSAATATSPTNPQNPLLISGIGILALAAGAVVRKKNGITK